MVEMVKVYVSLVKSNLRKIEVLLTQGNLIVIRVKVYVSLV